MGRSGKVDIHVETACSDEGPAADWHRLEELAKTVCGRFGKNSAHVSIAVVNDAAIREVNERFLGRNAATDVISFDLSDEEAAAFELVINVEEAQRQAAKRGHSVEAELALYAVHGLLHQLGFDDAGPADAERMHAAEDAILLDAGFGRVYSRPPTAKGRAHAADTAGASLRKGTTK